MTNENAQLKINEKIASDCLHILKDFSRAEKNHRSRIAKACYKVSIELDSRDQAFKQLSDRIDRLIGAK